MRKFATSVGIVALLLAVGIGGFFATFLAWPVGPIGIALVFVAVGWVTRRWWAAAVIPLVVAIWAGLTYVSNPGGWNDGHDITTAGWFAAFGIGAAVAGVAVFVGVLARKARDHAQPDSPRRGGPVSA